MDSTRKTGAVFGGSGLFLVTVLEIGIVALKIVKSFVENLSFHLLFGVPPMSNVVVHGAPLEAYRVRCEEGGKLSETKGGRLIAWGTVVMDSSMVRTGPLY